MTRPMAMMVLGPWVVEYEQEMIRKEGAAPDEQWRFMDAAGHGHFCLGGNWPTLRRATETVWCDEHDTEEMFLRWECPHCGERITPKMIDQSILGRSRPGPISMTIRHTAEGITREFHLGDEDARAVLANPIEEIPRRTATLQPTTIEYRR